MISFIMFGPWGEIVLEDGLPTPLHISKHTLAEVPTKQFICDTVGVVWISAHDSYLVFGRPHPSCWH